MHAQFVVPYGAPVWIVEGTISQIGVLHCMCGDEIRVLAMTQ